MAPTGQYVKWLIIVENCFGQKNHSPCLARIAAHNVLCVRVNGYYTRQAYLHHDRSPYAPIDILRRGHKAFNVKKSMFTKATVVWRREARYKRHFPALHGLCSASTVQEYSYSWLLFEKYSIKSLPFSPRALVFWQHGNSAKNLRKRRFSLISFVILVCFVKE